MTTIDQLAAKIAGTLGIADKAATTVADTYTSQLEALESREIDRDDISTTDADFILEACRQAQRAGDLGARELAELEDHAIRVEHAQNTLLTESVQRDRAIITAIRAGARIKDVMSATGLTRSRIYQIREGVR